MSEKKPSLAYKIYSAILIAVAVPGFVLANYFPEQANKLGLGFLNSQKDKQSSNAAYSCQLKWDWDMGGALVGRWINYDLNCTPKVAMNVQDLTLQVVGYTRYDTSNSRSKDVRHINNAKLLGNVSWKAGQTYSYTGKMRASAASPKIGNKRRQLLLSGSLSYEGQKPSGAPDKLFLSTGVH